MRRPPVPRGRLISVPFDGPVRAGRIRPGGPSSFPSPLRIPRLHLRPPGFPKEHAGHCNRLGVTAPILKNRDQQPSPTLLPPHDHHLPSPVAQAMKRSERVHDGSESVMEQSEPRSPPCMGLRAHVLSLWLDVLLVGEEGGAENRREVVPMGRLRPRGRAWRKERPRARGSGREGAQTSRPS